MIKYIINSAAEMQQFASQFALTLKEGDILTLHGEIGFGKTTFIQGLAIGLGIDKRIISPTFVLMRTYTTPEEKHLYHIDLYRLDSSIDSKSLGLEEIFQDKQGIVAIEWPERLEGQLPVRRIDILFTFINDTTREITIRKRN